MNQLTLMLPKVDEKATRAKVKEAYKLYHENKATLKAMEQLSNTRFMVGLHSGVGGNTTAMYPKHDADMIRGGKVRNVGQDMNELIERMQQHQQQVEAMKEAIEIMERVVDNLPEFEREIMKRTLLLDKRDRQKDSLVWPELNLCKSDYYEYKEKAMLRIAFALQIEVYEVQGEEQAA